MCTKTMEKEHKDGECCGGRCSGGVILISFKVVINPLIGEVFAILAVAEGQKGKVAGTFIARAVAESPAGWEDIFTATPETHKNRKSLEKAFATFLNKYEDRTLVFWGEEEGNEEVKLLKEMWKDDLINKTHLLFLGKEKEKDPLCIASHQIRGLYREGNILSALKTVLAIFHEKEGGLLLEGETPLSRLYYNQTVQ